MNAPVSKTTLHISPAMNVKTTILCLNYSALFIFTASIIALLIGMYRINCTFVYNPCQGFQLRIIHERSSAKHAALVLPQSYSKFQRQDIHIHLKLTILLQCVILFLCFLFPSARIGRMTGQKRPFLILSGSLPETARK